MTFNFIERMFVQFLVCVFMFLSCFEKMQCFSKISFLQKSVHGQLGTKMTTVLTVFADLGVLPKKSLHKHF